MRFFIFLRTCIVCVCVVCRSRVHLYLVFLCGVGGASVWKGQGRVWLPQYEITIDTSQSRKTNVYSSSSLSFDYNLHSKCQYSSKVDPQDSSRFHQDSFHKNPFKKVSVRPSPSLRRGISHFHSIRTTEISVTTAVVWSTHNGKDGNQPTNRTHVRLVTN